MMLLGNALKGVYDVDVAAYDSNGAPVASAPPINQVAISLDMVTNLGLVTLTPCGTGCP
jgi:hypothetical protein